MGGKGADYDGVHHSPLGAFFQDRLLDSQEEANTERYLRLRVTLGEMFHTPTFLAPTLRIPNAVEMSSMENRPRGV